MLINREIPMKIGYIAKPEITPTSGMGRVAFEWREALKRRNVELLDLAASYRGINRHLFVLRTAKVMSNIDRQSIQGVILHEPLAWTGLLTRTPSVIMSHGLEERGLKLCRGLPNQWTISSLILDRSQSLLNRAAFRRARLFLAISEDDVNYLQRRVGVDRARIYKFDNGCDPVGSIAQPTSGTTTVLFNGSWIDRKGKALLIYAAKALDAERRNIRWVLIGTGTKEKDVLEEWPPELRSRVVIIERFDRKAEVDWVLSCTVFVLPSYFEGQPLSLLQAMRLGRCCVTSDCCGQRDLVTDRVNGLLFRPGDSDGFLAALRLAIDDSQLRARLGQEAARSLEDWDWPSQADKVVNEIIKSLGKIGPRSITDET
jgi:glycosyltransferase involved in cell wall biosynthesis